MDEYHNQAHDKSRMFHERFLRHQQRCKRGANGEGKYGIGVDSGKPNGIGRLTDHREQ